MNELDIIKENISILDVAKSIGLTPVKIGSYYTLKEHDSVRINPARNLFIRNSTGEKGSVIDFTMAFTGMDIHDVINKLKGDIDINHAYHQKIPEKEKVEFELPEKDSSLKNVFAYLIKTRCIDSDIVKEFVDKKFLYQDKYKNCVFVSYKDDIPVFASKRGTNTYKKFIGDVAGSDYKHCFFIDNNSKNLIVIESVIDAMSLMSIIKMSGKSSYNDFNYLSLSGGTKFEESLKNHIGNNYSSVILCLDNDEAGITAADNIKKYIQLELDKVQVDVLMALPPEGDYNDYLKTLVNSNNMLRESKTEYVKNNSPLKLSLQKIEDKENNMLHEKLRHSFPFMTEKDINATVSYLQYKFHDFLDLEKIWSLTKEGKLYDELGNWEISSGGYDLSYEISYKGEAAISIFRDGNVDINSGFIYVKEAQNILDILNEIPLSFEDFIDKNISKEKVLLLNNDVEI